MNNFYGGSMSEYLPYGGFKCVKTMNETVNRILNKIIVYMGFFWKQIQILQKIYMKIIPVFQWHQKKLKGEMLSPYCLEIKEENNIKVGVCNKLIPNLMPKK